MLKHALIILILGMTQVGCYISEESGGYKPVELSSEWRQALEQLKRKLLMIEDVKIGDGPLAAVGRKVTADIEVRYASGDSKPIYRGPAISYFGMQGDVFIHNDVVESGILSLQQQGIILGLNGMAVGGKRRITVSPNLVCYEGAVGESTSQGADPSIVCRLVKLYLKNGGIIQVRKEALIVEATLTDSCIPVFMKIPFIYKGQFRCRDSDIPKHDPSAPIWRIY
ncbi:hypothetical protein [Nitrospira lenta]|uniref:Uncharacterized protein n=1 Tax=Nitrospira lenta TaxID=1436998 RepID=A0A330L989_9BACT|nr:hypothetical protein [Nitrospira lenta]SPP66265.1 hypothetical protein NITLEN_60068 [Nitrospira lenta]